MNKKMLFITILIVIIVAGGSLILYMQTDLFSQKKQSNTANQSDTNNQSDTDKVAPPADNQIATGIQPGKKAPDFTLNTINDKKRNLSDYHGQKIFLNFWATWCPPCRQEMPAIQKLKENKSDIKVIAVNIGEDKGKVLNYLLENNLNFSVLLDKEETAARQYQIRGIPTTLIIDEKGIIEKRHSGGLTYEQMLSLIE